MLETETANAYLIELNPRATQIGHLRLGPGRDLPAALHAAVSGNVLQEARRSPRIIQSLYSLRSGQESQSPFLLSGYHDIPWEEPSYCALVCANLANGPLGITNGSGSRLLRRFTAFAYDHPTTSLRGPVCFSSKKRSNNRVQAQCRNDFANTHRSPSVNSSQPFLKNIRAVAESVARQGSGRTLELRSENLPHYRPAYAQVRRTARKPLRIMKIRRHFSW